MNNQYQISAMKCLIDRFCCLAICFLPGVVTRQRRVSLRLVTLVCLLWFGVLALRADTNYVSLDGQPRLDRFSGRVDMGAYEFAPQGSMFRMY